MNNNSSRVFFFLCIFITSSIYAQNWKTIPDAFTTQCKTSFINDINKGVIPLQKLKSNSESFWVVYSDRGNNRLKNRANGSNNGSVLDYMEPLYVKSVSDNWLHVFGVGADAEIDDEKGWIQARYLLLSNYSLKTEGEISVPRKAIILTSLDDIETKDEMDNVLNQKHYYPQPQPTLGSKRGTPKSFEILFIMKEQDGSVLLSNTDVLNGSKRLNITKVYGWMPKANITKWNSRVALEPSRSEIAIKEYSGKKLPGYKDLQKLKSCLNDRFCSENPIVEFRVEKIRSTRMRKPILNPISNNIREIVSISKNSSELGDEEVDIYKDIIERLDRKSQMTNIVFAIDATSSMKPYINSVASSINKIIENNKNLNQHDLKFGLVVYRDYADGSDSYSYEKLTTNEKRIMRIVRETKCKSRDRDLPEAQYNGLIKGINALDLDPFESNVVILIGDCGNHNPDPNGLKLNDVVNVFRKKNINLISFQVKNNLDDSYITFNLDAQDYILKTANKIIEGKGSKLKSKMVNIGNNTYKLDMNQKNEDSFENMFGRFVFASADTPMHPSYLEKTIVETLSKYMKTVDKNIEILRTKLSGTGGITIDTDARSEGLIVHVQDKLGITRDEAIAFLDKTEVTSKAYVAIDYNGNGTKAQVPVVFLTENEKITLIKSLRKLVSGDCVSRSERKKCLKDNLITVCKSILGPKTTTASVENLTLQQVWKIIIGIDFEDEKLKDVKLIDVINIKRRDFDSFYTKFEIKSKDFCDKVYVNSDSFKSRRFSLFSSYFYWIPLEDLPGTK